MTLSIDLSDEELEKILLGDRGKDLLMEKVFNQILEAEMTEHIWGPIGMNGAQAEAAIGTAPTSAS